MIVNSDHGQPNHSVPGCCVCPTHRPGDRQIQSPSPAPRSSRARRELSPGPAGPSFSIIERVQKPIPGRRSPRPCQQKYGTRTHNPTHHPPHIHQKLLRSIQGAPHLPHRTRRSLGRQRSIIPRPREWRAVCPPSFPLQERGWVDSTWRGRRPQLGRCRSFFAVLLRTRARFWNRTGGRRPAPCRANGQDTPLASAAAENGGATRCRRRILRASMSGVWQGSYRGRGR